MTIEAPWHGRATRKAGNMDVKQLPMLLSEEGQKLLSLAVETVREECCLNGCRHCKSKRQNPLRCKSFKCGSWVIDCESYACRGVA